MKTAYILASAALCRAALGAPSGAVPAAPFSPGHRAGIPLFFVAAPNGSWTAPGTDYRVVVGSAGARIAAGRSTIELKFVGALPGDAGVPENPLPGRVNYLIGSDPKQWRRDVPTFARVRYRQIYKGIDAVWYGERGRLEYDLVVQPGADPHCVRLRFAGANRLALDDDGGLRIETSAGPLTMGFPPDLSNDGGQAYPDRRTLRAAAWQRNRLCARPLRYVEAACD
jgi:hypothetical protein